MEIRQATEAELLEASRLTVPGLPASDRHARRTLESAPETLGIELDHQVVAVEGGTLCGACLYVLTAGRGATVLRPVASSACPARQVEQVLCDMIRRAGLACRQAGAALVQALVDSAGDEAAGRWFTEAGFAFLARLEYLELKVPHKAPELRMDEGWQAEDYRPELDGELAHLIEQTYQGSLDCPALDGLRSAEDVLASHKASGIFTGRGWFLVRRHGAAAGLVLVNRLAGRSACELVYMGVAPQFRRQGLGRWLVCRAIATARQLKCRLLTVAVDAANVPARQLYEAAGFVKVNERDIYYLPPDVA